MTQASELPAGVRHLRCPNPGPMTLTGTNTYVVRVSDGPSADVSGGRASAVGARVIVIDPGPQEPSHRAAIVDVVEAVEMAETGQNAGASDAAVNASEGPVVAPARVDILLTHHHDDHEGGAASLAEALQTRGHAVQIWGGGSGRALGDGGVFGDLQVILTPGHTADSVAFLLVRDEGAVLFSGDTLLGGSSSFIAHPDGDLTAYLMTLDVLETVLGSWPEALLAPGHGEVGGRARDVIAAYRAHREARLEEVRAALRTCPGVSGEQRVDIVIEDVYAGVDDRLRPAVVAVVEAQLAHLDRLSGAMRPRRTAPGSE